MAGFLDMTREDKVAQFLKAAGKLPYEFDNKFDESYLNGLLEETKELEEAVLAFVENPSPETRAQLCKEWADVQVVLSNIAVYFNIPAGASFTRVHENNMTKVVEGKIKYREDGKVLKPEGYVKPDMGGL